MEGVRARHLSSEALAKEDASPMLLTPFRHCGKYDIWKYCNVDLRKEAGMGSMIQVNARGIITLPKEIRKALGLDKGGVVMAEQRDGGVMLMPAVAYPIEIYSDDRVAEFDSADRELINTMDGGKKK
jgi:AbrB family looped-hinge helix DNA binding protein